MQQKNKNNSSRSAARNDEIINDHDIKSDKSTTSANDTGVLLVMKEGSNKAAHAMID